MHVKKGDEVLVLTGKDAGKKGKIIKAFPKTGKVAIDGVNVYKKHQKPKSRSEKGQIIDVTRPIDASNVRLVSKK